MKKYISLLLVFSILVFSGNLFTKEKRGANIAIYKIRIDEEKLKMKGTPWETVIPDIKGELIAVKQNSLLLMERESGIDITVNISEIKVIKIKKKSAAGWGFIFGFAVGGGGTLVSETSGDFELADSFMGKLGVVALMGVITGGVVALISEIIVPKDETVQFEGKADSEIQEILEKLCKKARIKNAQ
jgi:hypothetical protein